MLKVVACILVSVILCNAIPKERKELSLLLSITACVLVCIAAITNLKPVLLFIEKVRILGNLNSDMLNTLIQIAGVSMVAEVTSMICQDFGNGGLGKSLQLMAICTILWLSVPIFEEMLILIEEVLGAI